MSRLSYLPWSSFVITTLLIPTLLYAETSKVSTVAHPEILGWGAYHGDDVNAQSGEQWFGLIQNGESYELRLYTITIELFHDEMVDEGGEQTGKKVSLIGEGEPLILMRGIPELKEGKIKTHSQHVAVDDSFFTRNQLLHRVIYPGQEVDCRVNEYQYKVFATGVVEAHDEFGAIRPIVKDYQLFLSSGKEKILLSRGAVHEGPTNTIMWSGDLDNDGKIDLLVDTSYHYNVSEVTLFLSSFATQGILPVKVASFHSTGC